MSKEFRFFTYLLESYAQYKGTTAAEVLRILDEKKLTDFVYNMYWNESENHFIEKI